MLAYIDESGIAHYHDSTKRPVVLAVCISEELHRTIAGRVHRWRKDLPSALGWKEGELKGRVLIKRRIFEKFPSDRDLVDRAFDLILESEIAVFAVIMNHPRKDRTLTAGRLPSEYRRLIQRVNLYMEHEHKGEMAVLVFDGKGTGLVPRGLAPAVEAFLFRSEEGRSYGNVVETPLFVDSKITPGIQLADLAASAVRQFYENKLDSRSPHGRDSFLLALCRYNEILQSKTHDYKVGPTNHYGFYKMPPRFLYERAP